MMSTNYSCVVYPQIAKFQSSLIPIMKNSLLYFRRKSVVNIVVLEGPSVQRIYQQVIRDFPGLVGAGWESRRRQVRVYCAH